MRSRPSRARGLKPWLSCIVSRLKSRPSRARGLKHTRDGSLRGALVAPLAGAWIETTWNKGVTDEDVAVAPLAGAWIETTTYVFIDNRNVAPLAGAWIETPWQRGSLGLQCRAPRGRVE